MYEIEHLEEAGGIIADVLNDLYDVEVAVFMDEEEMKRGEATLVPAHFIWRSYGGESAGKLVLYTEWYNIGEVWEKELNFAHTNLEREFVGRGKVSQKSINRYVKEVAKELSDAEGIVMEKRKVK